MRRKHMDIICQLSDFLFITNILKKFLGARIILPRDGNSNVAFRIQTYDGTERALVFDGAALRIGKCSFLGSIFDRVGFLNADIFCVGTDTEYHCKHQRKNHTSHFHCIHLLRQ